MLWLWRADSNFDPGDEETIAVLVVAGLWAAGAVGVLSFPKGRLWVVGRWKEWCLTALSLVVCLAFLDTALALLGRVPTVEQQRARSIDFSFGPYTKNRLVAKDILVRDGKPIHINHRGARGREISPAKKPGVIRVLFLGGSQVFSYVGNWPAKVGENLRRKGYGVEVVNGGVPGHTTFDSLGKLLADYWTLKPDIIVLCQAWNDLKYFVSLTPDIAYRGPAPAEPLVWARDWRLYPSGIDRVLALSPIYRHFRWRVAKVLYSEEGKREGGKAFAAITPWGPEQYRINLTLIADFSELIAAKLVVCKQAKLAVVGGTAESQKVAQDYALRNTSLTYDALMAAFERTYSIIDDVAASRKIWVSDMNKSLSGHGEYFRDGIHFNDLGSRAASDVVSKTLLPLMTQSASSRNSH